jgi:hypothetical protein
MSKMPPSKTYIRSLAARACRVSIDEIGLTGFGLSVDSQVDKTLVDDFDFLYYLVWFAAMDEREACAKVCEDMDLHNNELRPEYQRGLLNAARAIRGRSHVQQEPQK